MVVAILLFVHIPQSPLIVGIGIIIEPSPIYYATMLIGIYCPLPCRKFTTLTRRM